MRRAALTKGIVILFVLGCVREAAAGYIYQTGFEKPSFTTGPLAGQGGWSVFGFSPAAVTVQDSVAMTGKQAVRVNAAAVGQNQVGPWHSDPFDTATSANKTVVVDAEVLLKSSSKLTSWQFAALTPNLGTFFGGFNVLLDGRLQLITAGFPQTQPVITRDVWNHFEVRYDFDTFGDGNDQGFLDNVSIQDVSTQAVPEPSTIVLFGMGGLALLGYRLRRQRRPV